MWRFLCVAFLVPALVCTISMQTVAAQTNSAYPTKPVRVLVPFSGGSAADILARLIAPKLYEAWGQQFVVDNRPSAGGIVAGGIVATAVPDGYTLMLTSSAFAGSAALYPKMPYDSIRDFSGIMPIVSTPLFVVVAPSLGVKTLKELLALALIRSGRLLALAATTPQRVPMLPEVPTAAEAGLPGYEYVGWFGMLAPAKTPRAIIAKLNSEVRRILESAEIRDKIANQGAAIMPGTPEALEKLIREEIVTRRRIFAAAGIKPD
jgi:tripartite-type tricarboxylate transporter receptor subunit TctC